jgi:hypothetical protein
MRWRRPLVPLIFVPLACIILFGGIYYKVWTFQEITPYILAALIGGMPTAIAYGFKRGDNAPERATLTTPAPIQEQIPSLAYGRIIIRHRTENQHDGTYRDSDYLLEIINSTPNTLARDCQSSFDLYNNSEITDFVGFWNKNDSHTISIGNPELLKLFTVSLFYKGNWRVDTKLYFYVKSSIEDVLDYFVVPYGESLNRELRVLVQSENARYPTVTEAFAKMIQYIMINAVEG